MSANALNTPAIVIRIPLNIVQVQNVRNESAQLIEIKFKKVKQLQTYFI